jgi:cytochrome c biogenesis protein CcmG/thiol:disulfide interchange protein DsbE
MKLKLFFFALLVFAVNVSAQNISTIKLKGVDGSRFEMADNLGKGPVIVSFWATWCKPCRKELPALQEVLDKYTENGLSIVAISLDSPRSQNKVKSYVKSSGLPYTFLLDPNNEVANKYFVKDIPYTLLADKEGNVVYTHRGYREGDEKELDAKIAELLGAQAGE